MTKTEKQAIATTKSEAIAALRRAIANLESLEFIANSEVATLDDAKAFIETAENIEAKTRRVYMAYR